MRQSRKPEPVPELTPNGPYGNAVKREVQRQQDSELNNGMAKLKEESRQMNIALDAVRQAGYARAQFNQNQTKSPQPSIRL